MEENRESVSEFAQKHGLTEEEANVFLLLVEASKRYTMLPPTRATSNVEWREHIRPLYNLMMRRVVERDYPEGWFATEELEEELEGGA